MTPDRVLFVGLGGAGQRHLRILRARLPQARFTSFRRTGATPVLNPDFTVAAGKSLESEYGLIPVASLDAGLAEKPDLVVISTPSALHLDPMLAAARQGCGILVEKPWSHSLDGFDDFRRAVEASASPFRLSFQRRHHPLLKRVKDLLEQNRLGRVITARFEVGSYVPVWHGYEDWRNLYAVRPELGGGVLLTEIHEIDLAHWFFGTPQSVFCTGGNFGPEKLEVEDTAQLSLDYGGFSAQLSLCFMQKKPRRGLEISGTDGFLTWTQDGNRLTFTDYASGQVEEWAEPAMTNDSMFEAQADALLADFGPGGNDEHLGAAWTSQAVVAAARRSMTEKRAIPLPPIFAEAV
jgi:predicted dehydrogenase